MDIDIPIPTAKDKQTISFRNLKSISPSALSASLTSKISASPPPLTDNPSDLTKYYNETLSSCLNQLAPIKTKTVSFTHSAPWYTPELHKMKSRKRQLERLHKKTGLTVHLQAYTDYLQQYKDALNTARSTYYSHLIHSGSTNPKVLFSMVNKLLKPSNNTSNSFTTDKCNSFLSFFQTKKITIYNDLSSSPAPTACTPSPAAPLLTSQSLSQFTPMSPGELPKVMKGMKTSTCVLDPIPSHLIKDSLPAISTLITQIINSSLRSGLVPAHSNWLLSPLSSKNLDSTLTSCRTSGPSPISPFCLKYWSVLSPLNSKPTSAQMTCANHFNLVPVLNTAPKQPS
uniref:Uncharacterized protein n=1 Tax=Larimichthys crocea TaxID=215358 RepID=A0A0F8B8R9_LARCR